MKVAKWKKSRWQRYGAKALAGIRSGVPAYTLGWLAGGHTVGSGAASAAYKYDYGRQKSYYKNWRKGLKRVRSVGSASTVYGSNPYKRSVGSADTVTGSRPLPKGPKKVVGGMLRKRKRVMFKPKYLTWRYQ